MSMQLARSVDVVPRSRGWNNVKPYRSVILVIKIVFDLHWLVAGLRNFDRSCLCMQNLWLHAEVVADC